MKPDIYTKAVLTIIAIMLTVIVCKPIISPDTTARADGPFSEVEFGVLNGVLVFFDTRTGDIYNYADPKPGETVYKHAKLAQLGQPLR